MLANPKTIDRTRTCDDDSCTGWIHMDDSCGRGPAVERCDTCKQFPTDDDAIAAHDLECKDGAACEYRQDHSDDEPAQAKTDAKPLTHEERLWAILNPET